MEYKELGELAQINNGYAFKSKNYKEDGIRIVRITNVQKGYIEDSNPKFYDLEDMEGLERFYLHEGDILVSLTGNVGRVARVTREILPAALNQRVGSIKPFENIDNDYLFYIMNSNKFENLCINQSNGVAQQNLGTIALSKIKIPVPSLDIQKQIVEILDKSQNLIDNRKEQIKLLDDLIESIFYDMFGDPVLNERKWEVKSLGEMGNFKNGMNYSKSDVGYDLKCLGVGDFQQLLKINDVTKLTNVSFSKKPSEDYLLKDRDIVFVRSNGNKKLVGRNLIVYLGNELSTFSGFCIRLRINDNNLNSDYLNYTLSTSSLKTELLQNIRGANIQNLNQKILSNHKLPIPPLNLQNQFVEKVQVIEKQKQLEEDSLKLMEDNYNNLMQRAFKGELF